MRDNLKAKLPKRQVQLEVGGPKRRMCRWSTGLPKCGSLSPSPSRCPRPCAILWVSMCRGLIGNKSEDRCWCRCWLWGPPGTRKCGQCSSISCKNMQQSTYRQQQFTLLFNNTTMQQYLAARLWIMPLLIVVSLCLSTALQHVLKRNPCLIVKLQALQCSADLLLLLLQLLLGHCWSQQFRIASTSIQKCLHSKWVESSCKLPFVICNLKLHSLMLSLLWNWGGKKGGRELVKDRKTGREGVAMDI